MSELVGGDDDAREAAGVLDDGDAVHLLQPLVDHARATHVGEARRPAVALTDARLATTHVQPANRKRDTSCGQSRNFKIQIFFHLSLFHFAPSLGFTAAPFCGRCE